MREREPHNWSVTLPWRPMGATLRIHVLFPSVVVGVVLWVATSRDFAPDLWKDAVAVMAMFVGAVALHELGHMLAARAVAGDVPEVVLWPLGGLEVADVPHDPAAHWWTAVAGPAMNLALACAAAAGLAILGYAPPLNPLASPLNPRAYNWRERKLYFTAANHREAELFYYHEPGAEPGARPRQVRIVIGLDADGKQYPVRPGEIIENLGPVVEPPRPDRPYWVAIDRGIHPLEPARLGLLAKLLAQFFAVNWLLFWINLLPAFPLDGARLFQSWLWRRGDYRTSMATTAYLGFLVMVVVGVYAIAVNSLLIAVVAVVLYSACRGQLLMLARSDDEPAPSDDFDFSEGFSQPDRETEEAPPRPAPPRVSLWRRWLHERAERRRLRELQAREAEEYRLDALLEKIHQHGRASLTDEELRFLRRVSHRYPHRKPENP